MHKEAFKMNLITKTFPGVKALDKVTMRIKKGEIHALCGENGAGKSTLIKILSGVYPFGTYQGEIILNGKTQEFHNINDAEKKGVVCIHQELALVDELTVKENIFLGNEPNRRSIINWDELYQNTIKLLSQLNLNINPDEKVLNLGVAQKQLIEIAKALSKNAKILVLDEPTSSLTETETEILLSILKRLRSQGVTCIYISHKLDEVFKIANTITVLRDGKLIGTKGIKDVDKNELIFMMVGRKLEKLFPREKHIKGEKAFEIKNFSVYDPKISNRKLVKHVSFQAYRGEILGIAGLVGSGRTELVSSIFGAFSGKKEGNIYIDGKKILVNNPKDAINNGLALIPEDRKDKGLVLKMDVKSNITLASLKKISNVLLNNNQEIRYAVKNINELNIKTPSIETLTENLSGGNQQKVVISKWLMTEPKILILDEPTRGIDVGSKYEVYKIMNNLVKSGVVLIMVSSELEEVLGICDRILVMCEGQLSQDIHYKDATQEKIMCFATGGI